MTTKTKKMHLVLSAFLLGLLVTSLQAKTVRVSLGTLAPKNSSYHRILLAMGQEWKKAPEGGVRLKVYPSGVIGNESDMVREMRVGGIQAAMLTASGLADIDYAVGNIQSLPMMFRDLKEFEYVYKKMQPDLERRLEAKGFVVLFWVDAGWVYFFTNKKMVTPAELKQMKIFTASNVSETADAWRAGGYNPISLDPADIPMGLQTGMVDAVTVPPIYAMSARMDKTVNHMLDLKWAPLMGATVMHKKVWDQLTPAAQVFVKASAQKAGEGMVVKGRAENEESIEAMKKRGLVVHHADPEVIVEWSKAVESLHDTLRGGLVPEEIFDSVEKYLAEYRSAP